MSIIYRRNDLNERIMKKERCGSCKYFMKSCSKRRSPNSCDKPICERYEPRSFDDIVMIGRITNK